VCLGTVWWFASVLSIRCVWGDATGYHRTSCKPVTPVHCNENVSTLWRRLFRCLVVTGLRADRSLVRLPARGIDTSPLETPKRTGEPTQPPVHRVPHPLKWVKVKITLEQTTKTRRGSDIYLYSFFNLGAGCGWVIDARPGRFTPEKDPVPIV
jgi:hypothetical protein